MCVDYGRIAEHGGDEETVPHLDLDFFDRVVFSRRKCEIRILLDFLPPERVEEKCWGQV